MNIPVIRYDPRRAANAYAVHAALKRAERDDPELLNNPEWTLMRLDAFERFADAFEGRI